MTAPGAFSDDAFELLRGLLRQWGLDELTNDVNRMMTEGVSADVVPLRLRTTEAYKKRFAGNIAREKAGLPPLSEADYLATETALKKVVSRYAGVGYGDPASGFANRDNLTKWIGADVSPQELNDRMSLYQKQYISQPGWVKEAWASHGLHPWDAMVAIMDPAVSEAQLSRKMNTFALSSEAMQSYGRDGFDWENVNRFGEYADKGVSAEDVREGTSAVAAREERESFLAGLGGDQALTRLEQEKGAILRDSGAEKKRQEILDKEKSRFAENYLGGQSSLRRSQQGNY